MKADVKIAVEKNGNTEKGMPVLRIKGLSFAYSRQKSVLEDIDLTLYAGEVLALLGINGAGKSTLIRLLLGLEKKQSGEIIIADDPIENLSRLEIAARVAYVPQAHVAPFPYSVREVVRLGRIAQSGLMRSHGKGDDDVVDAAMARLGIMHLADRVYTRISGGERQLVLIARALAQGARILIMDEPASGLDYGNQIRLLEQLRRLAEDGYAILKSTHNPDHVFLGADRVASLVKGRIQCTGRPHEILTKEKIHQLYEVDVEFLSHRDGRTAILAKLHYQSEEKENEKQEKTMEKMNVRHYNDVVAKGYFRKVYPLLAQQVLDCTGVKRGTAIDLGGGPGMFGIALAKMSDMHVTIVDPNPECIEVAVENIIENDLFDKMKTTLGCAESIPFPQNSVDLVISRGSMPFWDDQKKGIAETFRVVRPGGWVYIGCGMGSQELSIEIAEARRRDDPEWTGEQQKEFMRRIAPEKLADMLADLDIEGAIEAGPAGIWVVFQKPNS